MSFRPPYSAPHPWDDRRWSDMHRGRGPMVLERGRSIDVDFLGWRSTTQELQYRGWQISERRMPPGNYGEEEWAIAIRHPDFGISGMSVHNTIHTRRSMYSVPGEAPISLHMELGLPYMLRESRYHMNPDIFVAVDTRPYFMEVRDPYDLYSMPYFRPIEEGKDIFLAKASIKEIMQIALDKQAPEQAEIRARRMQESKRAEYRRRGETKARLILAA